MRGTILAHVFLFLTLASGGAGAEVQLDNLHLAPGFAIDVYAFVPNARQLALSETGIIYAGSFRAGKVYAISDRDGDAKADEVKEIATGLTLPTGIAWHKGDLYVAAVSTILRYRDIDHHLDTPPEPEVVLDNLPSETHHGWKFIAFGPADGKLYVNVGAPCNICLSEDPRFASILRIDVDNPGRAPEIVAHGVRNSVGFDWHPESGDLWFTDNGRDMLGDDIPPCELNRVSHTGEHFGYPFFHGNSIADPEFSKGKKAEDYSEPVVALGPHVAPLGMMFYTGTMLPAAFKHQAIIAEHGSWNRTPQAGHTGYRVVYTVPDTTKGRYALRDEVLVDGWLQNNASWGRPVDVLQMPDGSLLVSDDLAGVLYRITYSKPLQ